MRIMFQKISVVPRIRGLSNNYSPPITYISSPTTTSVVFFLLCSFRLHNLLVDPKLCPHQKHQNQKPLPQQTVLLAYQNQKVANLAEVALVLPLLFLLPRRKSDKILQPLLPPGDLTRLLMTRNRNKLRRTSMPFRQSLYVLSVIL